MTFLTNFNISRAIILGRFFFNKNDVDEKVRSYALFLIFLGLSTLSTSAETLILCGVVYIGQVDFDT